MSNPIDCPICINLVELVSGAWVDYRLYDYDKHGPLKPVMEE